MPKSLMMKCGHAANAMCSKLKGQPVEPPIPCCAICDCVEVAESTPDLTGRMACCAYRSPGQYGAQGGECKDGKHGVVPSRMDLAFFEHKPTEQYDKYYCGCFGWD